MLRVATLEPEGERARAPLPTLCRLRLLEGGPQQQGQQALEALARSWRQGWR